MLKIGVSMLRESWIVKVRKDLLTQMVKKPVMGDILLDLLLTNKEEWVMGVKAEGSFGSMRWWSQDPERREQGKKQHHILGLPENRLWYIQGLGNKSHGKCQGSECHLCLSLYQYDWPSVIPGPQDWWKSLQQGKLTLVSFSYIFNQPHLNPWEHDEAKYPGNHFQIHKRQEGDWEYSVWIYEGENHAWLTWSLSPAKWLTRWMRGEQWIWFMLTLARLLVLCPVTSSLTNWWSMG